MRIIKFLLCVCLCVSLSACQKDTVEMETGVKEIEESTIQEQSTEEIEESAIEKPSAEEIEESIVQELHIETEPETQETEESTIEENSLATENVYNDETIVVDVTFEMINEALVRYNDFVTKGNVKRMALIYLNNDLMPELLILNNGEYKLYTYDGEELSEITMPSTEIRANAYGPQHTFEDPYKMTFYWFEYVPFKGLIRVHGGETKNRHDYYLRYTKTGFVKELEGESKNYEWLTYEGEKEIGSERFLERTEVLGYDELIPCGFLYENIFLACENIGKVSDTQKVLNDFVNGKTDAMYGVEVAEATQEISPVMKSYKVLYDEMTSGEPEWGSLEYNDFDNDGKDELILHGYCGSRMFFDVIGETVYVVLETSGTADSASVASMDGKKIIERTDLLHGGRKFYEIMQYDACCCMVNRFTLYVEYAGTNYTENDVFEYNYQEISMTEFEAILNRIQ